LSKITVKITLLKGLYLQELSSYGHTASDKSKDKKQGNTHLGVCAAFSNLQYTFLGAVRKLLDFKVKSEIGRGSFFMKVCLPASFREEHIIENIDNNKNKAVHIKGLANNTSGEVLSKEQIIYTTLTTAFFTGVDILNENHREYFDISVQQV
jgi:uncharacterized protein YsxB (DUF464 family)